MGLVEVPCLNCNRQCLPPPGHEHCVGCLSLGYGKPLGLDILEATVLSDTYGLWLDAIGKRRTSFECKDGCGNGVKTKGARCPECRGRARLADPL
jgi:hypothetical protein